MNNIVLLIIALGRISELLNWVFFGMLLYTIIIYTTLKIYAHEEFYNFYNDNDAEEFSNKAVKKYKLKTTLTILIVSGIICALIPSQEELTLYFGSRYVTTQNYNIAKDELLNFIRDLKKEIENE